MNETRGQVNRQQAKSVQISNWRLETLKSFDSGEAVLGVQAEGLLPDVDQ